MATSDYGGYEYSFVDKKEVEKFTCAICTRVFKNPRQTGCCGQVFCGSCFHFWFTKNGGNKNCPHCRANGKQFYYFLDKRLKREVDTLKIHCTNKEEGCQWIGELGSLRDHFESEKGCGYVEVKCSNKCGRKIKRKDLQHHLEDKCSLRPYQCEYCGFMDTYTNITGHGGKTNFHYNQCSEFPLECPNKCGVKDIKRKDIKDHRSQCPEELVQCPFEEAGCKEIFVRHKLEQHMSANQQQHWQLIRDFKTKIAMLLEHNKELIEAAEAKGVKISTLSEALLHTKHQNSRLDAKNTQLEREKSAVQQENCKFKKEILRAEEDKQQLQQERSRLEANLTYEILRIKKENDRILLENEKFEEESTLHKQEALIRIFKLQQEISRLKDELDKMIQAKRTTVEENTRLEEDITRTQQELSDKQFQNSVLQTKQSRLEKELSSTQQELSDEQQYNLKLRTKNWTLHQELDSTQKELSDEQVQNSVLQRKNSTVEQELDSTQKELFQEQVQNSILLTMNSELVQELDSTKQELQNITDKNRIAEQDLRFIRKELSSRENCLCKTITVLVIIVGIIVLVILTDPDKERV